MCLWILTFHIYSYLGKSKIKFKKCRQTKSYQTNKTYAFCLKILSTIPFNWMQWLLIVVAMVISGSVLVITFWPTVRDDTKLTAFATMAVIVSLHALLGIGFKVTITDFSGAEGTFWVKSNLIISFIHDFANMLGVNGPWLNSADLFPVYFYLVLWYLIALHIC